jgi:hypothetical protein
LAALAMATAASGTIIRQEWHTGVSGSRQAIIDFLKDLANPVPVPNLEVIQDTTAFNGARDNYVAKFYGWVTVPETGTYQFHYACDDYGMLYVSQDENMENAVEVAYVDGWCAVAEWNKYPSQHSAPMNLKKGQVMAVMAFFQEAGGGDNMDLGWTGPGLSSSITAPTYLTNYITHIPPTPSKAKSPSPEDGTKDVPMDTTISWGAGKFAATHDVYLGTVFDDVNTASRANPKGVLISQGQADATFDLEGVVDFGQTYYWRIDEVNAPPTNTIFKGKIWSFTAEPFAYPIQSVTATASSVSRPDTGPQNTVNGSGLNADDQHSVELTQMWMTGPVGPHWIQYEFAKVYKLDEMLVWNSNQIIEGFVGFGAKNVVVEYSTDGATWTALEGVPEFAQAPGAPAYKANTTVDFGGVVAKYVKLTIDTNWGGVAPQVSLAEVRFLYVPVQAREPQPTDGATGVLIGSQFNWRPGREATSHKVFYGADSAAVTAGTVAGTTVTEHSYTPATMNFGTEYFWKVDEVGAAGTYAGDVWSFVSQEYAAIDNFESYTDDEGSRIYEFWIDGVTDGKSGSTVGYMQSPFAEKTIKLSGGQSMPLAYNNAASPFLSEAELAFGTAQNWTTNGADSLVVNFRGQAPGFAETASGNIIMSGIGADIWNVADQFRLAYKTLNGDATIVARVESIANSNVWAKGGVMIRQSIEPGSVHAFMPITPGGSGAGNGASFQHRLVAAAASTNNDNTGAVVAAPYWVKLERKGNAFTGFISPDGATWTQLGTAQTVPMTGPVLIGLALCSHDAAVSTSAVFSNLKMTGNVTGSWQHAEIGVAQPVGNSVEGVYLSVKDNAGKTKVVQYSDASATATVSWQQWKIPLSEFTAAGVKMNAVKSLVIGVGDKAAPKTGGTGTIFVDDIGYGRSKP